MEGADYALLRDEYNKRSIKLCSDLFKLTNNANFKRMCDLLQHDIDAHQPALILWKHINDMKPEHIQNVLEGNTQFFESESFHDERAERGMIHEFRAVWNDLSPANRKTVFTRLQNIFRIAELVRQSFYDEILTEAVM